MKIKTVALIVLYFIALQSFAQSSIRERAEQGDSIAQYELGTWYAENCRGRNDYADNALFWLSQSAEKGYAPAVYSMAICYREGVGVEKNSKTAFEWVQKAANLDYPLAIFDLGIYYDFGEIVARDQKKAFELYLKAANLGSWKAMYYVGQDYYLGEGCTKDHSEARRWFIRGAEGDCESAYMAGNMLYKGLGGEADIERAIEMYKIAADECNDAKALDALGATYQEKGNLDIAIKFYEKAARMGFQPSINELKKIGK